jgi:hypothetical protein
MATESQPTRPLDARRVSDGRPRGGGADIAPLGPRGANPLHLHAEELDVLRRLRASGHLTGVDDPVWDELETLGLVEIQVLKLIPDGPPTRCGMLTSLGRRYRTE